MNFLNVLVERTNACKKYRASQEEVKNTVSIVVDCMKAFNSLVEDEVNFSKWDRSFDNIPILNELSFYVAPASVRFNPLDRKSKDLLFKDGNSDSLSEEELNKFSYSYYDYINAITRFRGFFKKESNDNCSSLASLRKKMAFSDVLGKASNGMRVHYFSDVPFWPIEVNKDVLDLLFEDSYFNASVDDLKRDFMSNLTF
jgi:hypothetical protein